MKTKKAGSNQVKNSALRIGKTVGILLFIAFLGNFTIEGWNWGVMDFVIIGVMLFFAGMALDWVAKKISDPFHKLLAVLAIVAVFLLIWVELAVDAVSRMVELVF
jgi:hypothetical protein